ncbi:MAG: hypothetical protein AB1430_04130 [Pseudomonadota bacterium]
MSTHVTVQVPVGVTAPRGAVWVGRAISAVQALARAMRAERAARQRAREAAEVRAYARELEDTMPGMAADLYAAADRHAG